MKHLSLITEFNLNKLLKLANELNIKKELIVQILSSDGKFFLVYEEKDE